MARPTKLTPELQTKIVGYIKDGNYIETACQACGIDKKTYYNWMSRSDPSHPSFSLLYVEFFHVVKKAEAEAIADVVKKWKGAKPNEWAKWATFLERRDKGNWSKTETINQNVKGDLGITGDDIMKVLNDLDVVGKESPGTTP
ncbi:MAG: hypothetical protein HQ553_12550 [Chloroflexi bacterium]|nr:hypothetical protein [Chloroflexota bacterium]